MAERTELRSGHLLLETEGLVKTYPGVRAVDGVDFELRAGEIHALMGENGAGKSTLIRLMTGVEPPSAGTMRVLQHNGVPKSPREAEALGMSTVFQEGHLLSHLSVAENLALGRPDGAFGFMRWRSIRRNAKAALGRLNLDLDVDRPLGAHCAAIQQLVALARALSVDARILVLDEPTSSLDEREVERLFDVLRRLRDDGLGIVFVSHFLDQVFSLSDRVTVLRNGQLVGRHPTAELTRLGLIELMLGRRVEANTERCTRATPLGATRTPVLSLKGAERRGVVGPLNFELYEGEVLGLSGLLGSGRSEAARLLFGVEPCTHGELELRGQSLRVESPRAAIQHQIAFCSEDRKAEGIVPHLSVRENLILALQASRGAARLMTRTEQDALAQHYIKALKIKVPNAETPIGVLSGGNQQKVLIARWLALAPRVVLFDEPTRGIDVGAKAEVETLISELGSRGVATLLISSDLEELERNCDRAVVLRDRKQVATLERAPIHADDILRAIAHVELDAPEPPQVASKFGPVAFGAGGE
jgi:simple sugar transport system ATP-binding protein